MLSNSDIDRIIALIKREVVPAIGCTEPTAVSLCVAKATETLGQIDTAAATEEDDGITIKGIASLEHGKVVCGERNAELTYAENKTVHSLYRKFKQTADDLAV